MLKKDWQNYEGNERYEGFCVDLLKELNQRVPGKYKLRPVLDGNYGSMDETTGMWNGMIGEVKYNVNILLTLYIKAQTQCCPCCSLFLSKISMPSFNRIDIYFSIIYPEY